MQALTLRQPYAGAVAHLGKDIENRSWAPPKDVIGTRIAIHAGGARCNDRSLVHHRDTIRVRAHDARRLDFDEPRLAVVAVATVVGATHYRYGGNYGGRLTLRELEYLRINARGWALPDCWNWLLRDVIALPEPVPCKGRQKVWHLPEDVRVEVRDQLSSLWT